MYFHKIMQKNIETIETICLGIAGHSPRDQFTNVQNYK